MSSLCLYDVNTYVVPSTVIFDIWSMDMVHNIATKYEHNRRNHYFFNSRLSHTLLHSPKHDIFYYLTDIIFLTKL